MLLCPYHSFDQLITVRSIEYQQISCPWRHRGGLSSAHCPRALIMRQDGHGRKSGWLTWLLRRQSTGCEAGTRVLTFPPPVQLHSTWRRPRASGDGASGSGGNGGSGRSTQQLHRGNHTSTTKYTLLTFLPKSLFEQYRCGTCTAARLHESLLACGRCSSMLARYWTLAVNGTPNACPTRPQARRKHLLHAQRCAVADAI